jgi:carboxyl-terminal processing protease
MIIPIRASGWPLLVVSAWLLSAATGEISEAQALSLETFDTVWETIGESYYDPDFGGLDWEAMRDKYRPKAEAAASPGALRPVLNEMLAELGESHFGVIPGAADLEGEALVVEVEAAMNSESSVDGGASPETSDAEPETEVLHEGTPGDYSGLHLRFFQKEVVVSQVDPDSPASKAGLKAGHRVRRIGDLDVAAFCRKAEEAASKTFSKEFFLLKVLAERTGRRDAQGRQSITVAGPQGTGSEKTLSYAPIRYPGTLSTPVANLPSVPLRFETRQLSLPQGEVLYLHFNIFLPQVMGKIRTAILEASERKDVGLILDLRGNPGGIGMMANGLAGLLTDERYSLGTMTMRAGEIHFVAFPQAKAFLQPVAILVDSMSGSTSEIFAAGLQEAGRARVIGRRSMGAALPSFIRELPNGDRLQHAIANLTTAKGRRVEGRGVIPDLRVPLRLGKRFRGEDPDIDKALKWLQRELERQARATDPPAS